MYCPDCKYEYEEGVKVCADCGADLVGMLPEKQKGFEDVMDQFPMETDEKLVLLYTAASEIEADGKVSLLEANGIYVYKQRVGVGSYVNITQGFSTQGIKLLVLESDLDTAKELLNERVVIEQSNETVEDRRTFKQQEREFLSNRRKKMQILLFCLWGIPSIIAILYNLFSNMKF